MFNYWNPTNWDNEIPDFVVKEIYPKFFDESGAPIITYSQYHTENMWDHVNAVFRNFCELWGEYRDQLSGMWLTGVWGVLLHDIAKPDTIVEKQRKICPDCHRPNVPTLRERKVTHCFSCKSDDLTSTSDKWQVCNDCGKYLPHKLDAKDNTNCYVCKARLPEASVLQHGWHGHDAKGGSKEFLWPILAKIDGLNESMKEDILKLVRCHSIVHALMHREFESSRANAEANKQHSIHRETFEEFGFNPFEGSFKDGLMGLFANSQLATVAILLSTADDRGKSTEIQEEKFPEEFIRALVAQLQD